MIRNRITFILSDTKEAEKHKGEMHNLLASLDKNDPDDMEILRKSLHHRDQQIKSNALYFADKLPAKEIKPLIVKALQSPEAKIRHKAAFQIDYVFSAADIPWLEEIQNKEPKQHESKFIKKQIQRLE